ncbi:amino acid ABC transporter permease [Enterococcus gilvus]|uniref:Amino acid ABC transporter, amino acid-binding/permease n=1 Tax=Enterococcus gilvus ATCC BAA-350 TaxID=1158614 RepID=R2VCY5_9ENTE|nr:amino acid ABC transporter permease [Enterococcus gilvus]EOI55575.1 His/Glu/Gln/Arg/opine family amino ABC transporter, permease, 3-TM region [Enterococcus gilvus ATCC BAA-350]EOW81882.1 amino acid ABC transporter, amino acid-binding/permease [Enterococcus gilvus ATCC BAA-350]MBS5820282.1 amino acid ABC transporter permease [Enterococcus gilvus]OJG41507.1 His/Glu/Gln/Arg/opine family amino ABC transporter, permease, 3-TM region [Enterococcus gilvus]
MYIPTIDIPLMIESVPFLLSGLGYTLGISLAAFFFGNLLGILLTILGFVPWLPIKLFVRFYLSFLRGTPALVLLFLLYFGLPYQLNAVVAAVICFSLTSSAFIGEIYRGSIAGVNGGQWDAAYALGNRFFPTMRYIILPQAVRISIPALGNVAMDLLKGTSLAAMITVPDIFQKAKIIGGRTFDYLSMYILVALIYWLLCIGIGHLQYRLEKYFQQKYV